MTGGCAERVGGAILLNCNVVRCPPGPLSEGQTMSRWRAAAIERLPELRRTIASADSVMALWIELGNEFQKAYRDPRNDDLIRRIYAYADWCLAAPRNDDAGRDPVTAVAVAFYEHIPDWPAAREDMPRWFHHEEVASSKAVFSYLIGEQAFNELVAFIKSNRHRYVRRAPASARRQPGNMKRGNG